LLVRFACVRHGPDSLCHLIIADDGGDAAEDCIIIFVAASHSGDSNRLHWQFLR
jgi:hypothetical protein